MEKQDTYKERIRAMQLKTKELLKKQRSNLEQSTPQALDVENTQNTAFGENATVVSLHNSAVKNTQRPRLGLEYPLKPESPPQVKSQQPIKTSPSKRNSSPSMNTTPLFSMDDDMQSESWIDIERTTRTQSVVETNTPMTGIAPMSGSPRVMTGSRQDAHEATVDVQPHSDSAKHVSKRRRRIVNSELLDIADRIRYAHVKHESELGRKDQEILQLKLQLNDFKNADLVIEPTNSNYGNTASQELEALKMENQSLRRLGTERNWRIDELESQLHQSQSEGTLTDWLREKSEFEDQIELLKDQTRAHQSQIQQYMSAWKREQQLREDIKAKLDEEQRHVVKLGKELKRMAEELKIERMEGTREKYLRLRSAVSGLMAFEQIKGMATETFGDVGQAMKRLKDLITEEAGQSNNAGSRR